MQSIVIQHSDRGAFSSLPQCGPGHFPYLPIELVVAWDVEHRNWPIPEVLDRIDAGVDVPSKDQYVGLEVWFDQNFHAEVLRQELQVQVRRDLDFHRK